MLRLIMMILIIVMVIGFITGHTSTATNAGKWILSILIVGIVFFLGSLILSVFQRDEK